MASRTVFLREFDLEGHDPQLFCQTIQLMEAPLPQLYNLRPEELLSWSIRTSMSLDSALIMYYFL
jgi:hypothetical protein